MKPKSQYQHIVPQVYLKLFGFKKEKYGGKWCVSTYDLEKKIWQDRVIKRFLGENNLYDLDPSHTAFPRRLEEKLHGGVDGRIPKIINYLKTVDTLTMDMKLDLVETMSNFIGRSKIVLVWIEGLLDNGKLENFWEVISEENGIFENEEEAQEAFFKLKELPRKDQRNNLMVFYMLHVKLILTNASITVYKNNSDFHLFTTDNPVAIDAPGLGLLIDPTMQMFFPLSPDYLIHSYWDSTLLTLDSITPRPNSVLEINEELYEHFTKKIQPTYVERFIISPISKALLDEEE